ncbi:MAG TPA: PIN domain-containing protein [Tetrasphaera sp.]|nr:PIN domain-containing protein [Tetrasphaera sp.]
MIVLDAYAVIGLLRGDEVASEVRRLLEDESCAINSVNLAEVVDQLVRVFGRPEDDVLADLALLQLTGMRVIPVDAAVATSAGLTRAANYGSKRCPVTMADCVAAATASATDAALATADPDLANVARAGGTPVVALPDSDGRLP